MEGSKNSSFWPETDQFQIIYGTGALDWRGPKKGHFRQKRTCLKSFTGLELWIGSPQNRFIFAKNGPVSNRLRD